MGVYIRKYFLFLAICGALLGNGFGGGGLISVAQAAEESHGGGDAKEGAGPSFVKMDPLVVPLVDMEGVNQMVSLLVTFEVESPDDVAKIESLKPRVKDAMIVNMYGLLTERAAMDKGVLQVGYVKKRLLDSVQKVVGEGVLKDVLLQMVQQNPV